MLRRNLSRLVSRFVAIHDRRLRSDIGSRTTSYRHEGIINQARLKYSVQVYKKMARYLGTVGGTITINIE